METCYITTNNIKLHVVMDGPADGPLVVLLHGFPEHWTSYRHQIPALTKAGFRVVVPDQRGYNLSEKPAHINDYAIQELTADIVGLIKAEGRKSAQIVGHDWGGVVAHHLAMNHPDMVKKLVIMNSPHPQAMARELKRFRQLRRSWYMFYFLIPRLPERIFTIMPKLSANFLMRASSVEKQVHDQDTIDAIAEAWLKPGAMTGMLNWYRAGMLKRSSTGMKKIKAPTMIIWGEQDPALNINLTNNIGQWFDGPSKLIRIPDSGHWVQHEAATQVNQLLLSFLEH